jgi:hypothetical protein
MTAIPTAGQFASHFQEFPGKLIAANFVRRVQFLRYPRLLFLAQMIQHVPPLQSRALARWPQERGFRLPAAFATTPVSQSAP